MYQSTIKNAKKRNTRNVKNRDLVFPDEEGQHFAVVDSMLGNGRVKVLMPDGVHQVGRIAGSMRKNKGRTLILRNDLVVVATRDFEENKVDVVYKYSHEEVALIIRKYKDELTAHLLKALQEQDIGGPSIEDDTIVFEEQNNEDASEAGVTAKDDGAGVGDQSNLNKAGMSESDSNLDIDAI